MSYLSPPKPPWKEGYLKNHGATNTSRFGFNKFQLSWLRREIMSDYGERVSALEKEVATMKAGRRMIWLAITVVAATGFGLFAYFLI